MKKMIIIMSAALLVLLIFSFCGRRTVVIDPNREELNIPSTSVTENNTDNPLKNLFSFSFQAGTEQLSLPVKYKDLIAAGWTCSVAPNEYFLANITVTGVEFTKGNKTLSCMLANQTEKLMSAPETDVIYVILDKSEASSTDAKPHYILPKNIAVGEASTEEIEAAYGVPNDTYPSETTEGRTIWMYEYDKNEYIQLSIEDKTQILKTAALYRAKDLPAYTKIPDAIKNYVVPQALPDSVASQSFALDGIVYKMPVPVAHFLENGWTLDFYDEQKETLTEDTAADYMLLSNSGLQLLLTKGDQVLPVVVQNFELEDRPAADSFVVDLFLYADSVSDLIVSPGMTFATTKEEVDAVCNAYRYCYKEDNDLDIYWIYVNDFGYVSPVFDHETQKIAYFQFLCVPN